MGTLVGVLLPTEAYAGKETTEVHGSQTPKIFILLM